MGDFSKCTVPPILHSHATQLLILLSPLSREETEAQSGPRAAPGHGAGRREPICTDSSALQHTAEEKGPEGSALAELPAWAVGLPWPQGCPDSRAVLEPAWESNGLLSAGGRLSGADRGSQPGDWQLGSETQPKKSLASFAHKAPILSPTHWHRHSQTRASRAGQ